MSKDIIYRNLAGSIAVLLSLGVLVNSQYPEVIIYPKSLEALGWVVSFSLAFLWLNNRIMLFGLIIITIYGNLRIWLEDISQRLTIDLEPGIAEGLMLILYLLGIACLTMALWPQFYPQYLTRKIHWSSFQMVILVLLVSVITQFSRLLIAL